MNARATRRGVPAIALWGGIGALAWATITVLTGGGSAQADERNDPSLLGDVSSLVTGTVSTVGDTVTAVVEPVVTQVVAPVVNEVVAPVVNEVVAPVVHEVVAPVPEIVPAVVETVTDTVADVPVVGEIATPVVETVSDTAQAVATPVSDLLQDAPVAQIVDPVQDAVAALPVVGGLLRDLGVTNLLGDVAGVVDDTTGIVGEIVETTVPPVLVGLDPTESVPPVALPPVAFPGPGFATVPAVVPADAAGATIVRASVSTPASATRHPLDEYALAAPVETSAPATTASASGHASGPASAPAGGPLAPSSSANSGGASAVSPAGLTDAGVPALRAVERTSGASDDVLPTSLVADTDVSPD